MMLRIFSHRDETCQHGMLFSGLESYEARPGTSCVSLFFLATLWPYSGVVIPRRPARRPRVHLQRVFGKVVCYICSTVSLLSSIFLLLKPFDRHICTAADWVIVSTSDVKQLRMKGGPHNITRESLALACTFLT